MQPGNAPCSWGTIEGLEDSGIPYGVMLDELVGAGYRGTELGDYGYMPTDPGLLESELASRGLTMLGAYHGVELRNRAALAPGRAKALRIASLLASVAHVGDDGWRPLLVLADEHSVDPHRFAMAGRVPPEAGLSAAEWRDFGAAAQEIARAVRDETGIETVFHPHCAGFVETPAEIEALLEQTDPALLGMVFDTGHYLYGSGTTDGAEVLRGLRAFASRIRYVHFKDCDPLVAERARSEGLDYRRAVAAGVFCELGRGSVDFAAVLEVLGEVGYRGWITVEQDVLPGMGTPRESAERNREYLRMLGL